MCSGDTFQMPLHLQKLLRQISQPACNSFRNSDQRANSRLPVTYKANQTKTTFIGGIFNCHCGQLWHMYLLVASAHRQELLTLQCARYYRSSGTATFKDVHSAQVSKFQLKFYIFQQIYAFFVEFCRDRRLRIFLSP